MQIVIAWTEEAQEIVKLGRVDLGESHKFKTIRRPMAAVWLNRGTESDAAKARKYAANEGHRVFCYENERDPLAKARKDVMTAV
jgi:hypothetical protein